MNTVQEGADDMPKVLENPEQEILEQAKEILYQEGCQALSIRKVAAACGISVGTIYNYFPTKKELITRVMADYWENYLKELERIDREELDFYNKLRAIYNLLDVFVNTFREMWVDINALTKEEYKQEGHKQRTDFLDKLVRKLEAIISKKTGSNQVKISASLDANDLSRMITMHIILMTQMKQFNYDKFELLLKKMLN
jgi:AcrR family transcriptional regulator